MPGRLRTPILWAAAGACVVAPATMLAGLHSPLRVAAALALFCLAPGAAILPWVAARGARVELGLIVASSLALSALVAQVMLWLGAWRPTAATCLLAAACAVPIGAQLLRGRSGA